MAKQLDIKFIDIVSLLLRILLLAAFAAVMLHMFIGIYYAILGAINSPPSLETYIYSFIDVIVEDSLLAVVIFEIYESIVDFFQGQGDTIIYIITFMIYTETKRFLLGFFACP